MFVELTKALLDKRIKTISRLLKNELPQGVVSNNDDTIIIRFNYSEDLDVFKEIIEAILLTNDYVVALDHTIYDNERKCEVYLKPEKLYETV